MHVVMSATDACLDGGVAPTPHCFSTRQELLGSNEHKQELLQAIWRAFLVLAEHCMKVCWPSVRTA